jgi:hypothetical protein
MNMPILSIQGFKTALRRNLNYTSRYIKIVGNSSVTVYYEFSISLAFGAPVPWRGTGEKGAGYYSFHNQRFLSEFDRAHPLSVYTPPKFNDISQNS